MKTLISYLLGSTFLAKWVKSGACRYHRGYVAEMSEHHKSNRPMPGCVGCLSSELVFLLSFHSKPIKVIRHHIFANALLRHAINIEQPLILEGLIKWTLVKLEGTLFWPSRRSCNAQKKSINFAQVSTTKRKKNLALQTTCLSLEERSGFQYSL